MRWMRATLTVAALGLAALGCEADEGGALNAAPPSSGVPVSAPPASPVAAVATTTTPPAIPPATTALPAELLEAAYLAVVRTNAPLLAASSDADLVALGHQMCATVEEAGSMTGAQVALALQMARDGNTYMAESVGTVLGAAVVAYCPEYQDDTK